MSQEVSPPQRNRDSIFRESRAEFDDEESKKGTKKEIRHLQEITSPYLCHMVAQERLPGLSMGSFGANVLHILLNRPFDFSEYPA
jgi:hypothetical protein